MLQDLYDCLPDDLCPWRLQSSTMEPATMLIALTSQRASDLVVVSKCLQCRHCLAIRLTADR